MKYRPAIIALCLLLPPGIATAEDADPPPIKQHVDETLRELDAVRREIGDEKIPLMEQLHALENRHIELRQEYEAVKRRLDARTLDMNNLRSQIKSREQEKSYLSSLLTEYNRNLETRLHIAELNRYHDDIQRARLAPENSNLKPAEVFERQAELVGVSLARLEEHLGGTVFDGRAAGDDGIVKPGRFIMAGPAAFFAADDGSVAGTAEQRLGSLEPAVQPFSDPLHTEYVRRLIDAGAGIMPFDGSLGNARKIEETRETFTEHIAKGGAVMWPLLGMAGIVALIALYKWFAIGRVHVPTERRIEEIVVAVEQGRRNEAAEAAQQVKGPFGVMLRVGLDHFDAAKEVIEESMFEVLLDTKLRLQKSLPFIAVGAACAPLMGLLGTVTGIISTFKLITVFGSGDIKMLSAGISEALITTETGLYVAIPTILAHAFLSRKARALTDKMEQTAIHFMAAITKLRGEETAS